MFKLKWNNKDIIDGHLFSTHMAHMKRHAVVYNAFIMLIPQTVYDRIKKIGINATITILSDKILSDKISGNMIWIKVSEIKDKPTNCIDKRHVVAFDQFGRMLWKYPLPHRLVNLPKGAKHDV